MMQKLYRKTEYIKLLHVIHCAVLYNNTHVINGELQWNTMHLKSPHFLSHWNKGKNLQINAMQILVFFS